MVSKHTSLPYTPHVFKTIASLLYVGGTLSVCVRCLFKGGDSVSYYLLALPELYLLIFRVPDVKPH